MADDDNDSARGGEEVTETEETSWLSRLGRSFAGIVFGLLLVVASCGLLFWNEGRAVKTARSLSEGAGLVQSVAADKIDSGGEGKLVHVTGTLTAGGPATDQVFGIKSPGVRLARHVEMFQWIQESESETTKKMGGGESTRTVYKYRRDWFERHIDSSKFHERGGHINPEMLWSSRESIAPGVKLGAFSVPNTLLGSFGTEHAVSVPDDQAQALQVRLNKPVQIADGVIFIGNEILLPVEGNYRIRFAEVPLQAASVVARQAGSSFERYQTKAGRAIAMITPGQVLAADMFKEAQDDNRLWTWLIRLGGCVAMLVGFALIMSPLSVLADVLPILGDIVGAGTGIVAFLLTSALAPLVIAVAWFAYRPLVAVIVLAVGGVLVAGAVYLSRQYKARKAIIAHA